MRTFVRVTSETRRENGVLVSNDERYFLSSLPMRKLTPQQWLRLARTPQSREWGVETAHQVLDVTFEEDDRRWIEYEPRGNVVVAILRRVAYTLLALYRSVTLRSDEHRHLPWKDLIRYVHRTLTTDAPLGLMPAPG